MVACETVVTHASPSVMPHETARPAPRLHLDPIGGLAGDMFLAACLDLGVPLSVVTGAVAALGLRGVSVETWPDVRGGRAGIRLRVLADGESLEEDVSGGSVAGADWDLLGLLGLLRASGLAEPVRERAARMFRRLAYAWARSSGVPITAVRFAGAPGLDFLVDLVGAAAVIEHLAGSRGDEPRPAGSGLRVSCGPVFVGGAAADGAPVPPPVVAVLLDGLPESPPPGWWRRRKGAGQCLTPTGATLLAEVVDEWTEEPPAGSPRGGAPAEGWGLGAKELDDRPNALRVRWTP